MSRIIVHLTRIEEEALSKLARRNRRQIDDQAALFIHDCLVFQGEIDLDDECQEVNSAPKNQLIQVDCNA
jgi:hypothetical protein